MTDHTPVVKKSSRPSWDEYYMQIARVVATRSTCKRKAVGVVMVSGRMIISTGYNGSMSGAAHCEDVGCIVKDGHCIATTHAEINALVAAARHGISTNYTVIYTTVQPCLSCYKALVGAGIKRIVYDEAYGNIDYGVFGLNANLTPSVKHLSEHSDSTLLSD